MCLVSTVRASFWELYSNLEDSLPSGSMVITLMISVLLEWCERREELPWIGGEIGGVSNICYKKKVNVIFYVKDVS
jgi:hypothetical protein